MKKHIALVVLVLTFGSLQATTSIAQGLPEYWERDSAMTAVRSVDIDRVVYQMTDVSTLSSADVTLTGLQNMENRGDWPLPAREAAIYQFTRSLADLPRDAVAVEVIRYLSNYQARVLVPQEEHPGAYVPFLNIRGAAAGVENSWQRAEYAAQAEMLLSTNPTELVSVYRESANINQRAASLSVLEYARTADVWTIQDAALTQLTEAPELTALLGTTVGITADIHAIERLLTDGRGAGLSSTFVRLGHQLPLEETAALMDFAIQHAPANNAALAIAAWWPRLKHEASSRDALVDLLGDPALGASAVLALAQSPDVQTIKVLQDTADGDSNASKRAQMALDLSRERLAGEVQP